MIGDSTERKMMRKKAFDNKYLGFKSSTANKAKAMIRAQLQISVAYFCSIGLYFLV